jgi:integral membrane protein (TIGR01906 family)
MSDVRSLFRTALLLQLLVVLALVAGALACGRSRAWRSVVPRGLLAGSLVTLGVAVLAVPVILLGFDGLFLRFHELFFAAGTWRFSTSDTLLRLYPERFWQDTARLVAAITLGQSLVLGGLSWWWLRRVRGPGDRP